MRSGNAWVVVKLNRGGEVDYPLLHTVRSTRRAAIDTYNKVWVPGSRWTYPRARRRREVRAVKTHLVRGWV